VIEGGLVDGNMFPDKASIELNHRSPATGKVSSIIVKIKVPKNGRYARTAPILTDEFAKTKYLIEVQFHAGGFDGFLFRGELGEPTLIQDENFGEIVSIPCESIFRSIRETFVSPVELKQDPKNRFIDIILAYEVARANGTAITFRGGDPTVAINIPGDSVLNRSWIPSGPTKVKKALNNIIDILEDAPAIGGTLLDWFYDEEVSTFSTRTTAIFAEEFGLNSSGVVIDPITFGPTGEGAEKDKQVNTDNVSYKNHVIAKGDARSGTTPPNLQRFRSQLLNGQNRDLFDIGKTYSKGQGVKKQYPGLFPDERYFYSLTDFNGGNDPALFNTGPVNAEWYEDFTIDPTVAGASNRAAFYSPNPWFSDLNLAKSNIVGKGNAIFGAGQVLEDYVGAFFDWNIERTLYDRPIASDPYDRISVKSVVKRANIPPARSSIFNGYRLILGTFNVPLTNLGPGFEGIGLTVDGNIAFSPGNRGKVLEYNGDPTGLQGLGDYPHDTTANGWLVSEAPTDSGSGSTREQDTTNNLETMKILKWDKDAYAGLGDWVDAWDIATGHELPGSPFHIIYDAYLVAGATGIPNQAFECRFEWKSPGSANRFEKIGSLSENKNSRGVWLSWMHPLPYLPAAPYNTGDVCGKDLKFPFMDAYNLNRTCTGGLGWNNGLATEELGGVTGVHFKLRCGFFTGEGDTIADKALGYENMPHVYYAIDKWGHVIYQEFEQPGNYQWETHDLSFGVKSSQRDFYSRFDELANAFGYTLPYNWFIPEREFTGRAFDWRYVKYQGIFSKFMYSEDSGHYLGAIEQGWKEFTGAIEQGVQRGINYFLSIANGVLFDVDGDIPVSADVIIDHSTIAIDEFCFITELYANSDDAVVDDPRTDFVTFPDERDYLTLKSRAKAAKARKQFFPQFWHMGSIGDVRMKVGQRFIASGPQVPGGSKELVCAEVKFTDDQDGFRMQVLGINKFEATAGS